MSRPSPIPFPDPVVRLLLSGAKTQLRQPVRERISAGCTPDVDLEGVWTVTGTGQDLNLQAAEALLCPFGQSGDVLWVQEPYRLLGALESPAPRTIYRATARMKSGAWEPAETMPEQLSRIRLRIDGVRVERLQDISEEDAQREGPFQWMRDILERHPKLEKKIQARWFNRSRDIGGEGAPSYRGLFSLMWDSSTTKKTESWEYNPWVWVVSFRPEVHAEGHAEVRAQDRG